MFVELSKADNKATDAYSFFSRDHTETSTVEITPADINDHKPAEEALQNHLLLFENSRYAMMTLAPLAWPNSPRSDHRIFRRSGNRTEVSQRRRRGK